MRRVEPPLSWGNRVEAGPEGDDSGRFEALDTHVRLDVDRLETWAKHDLALRYGSVPADHPAYIQAAAALRACRKNLPPDIQLLVCPRLEENAMAIGRHIIVMGLPLLLQCYSHQGLAGIFGHELKHLEEQDTLRDVGGLPASSAPGDIVQEQLRQTSITRLAEHRADIHGALLDLDEAGTNPLGYILELERLDARSTGERSASHGSSLDRALLGRIGLRYIDMAHLSQQLRLVTQAERTAWQVEPAAEAIASTSLFEPYTTFDKFKMGEKRERWIEILREQSPVKRAVTITSLVQHWSRLLIPGIDMKQAKPFFAEVQQLLEADTDQLGDNPRDVSLRRFLHYQLNLGLNLDVPADGFKNKYNLEHPYTTLHRSARDAAWTELTTLDDARYLRTQLAVVAEHDMPYALGDPRACLRLLIKRSLEVGWFGDSSRADTFAAADFVAELEAWSLALADFAHKKCIVQPDAAQLFHDGVVQASGILTERKASASEKKLHQSVSGHRLVQDFGLTRASDISHDRLQVMFDWTESENGKQLMTLADQRPTNFREVINASVAVLQEQSSHLTVRAVGWLLRSVSAQVFTNLIVGESSEGRGSQILRVLDSLEKWHTAFLTNDPRCADIESSERAVAKYFYRSEEISRLANMSVDYGGTIFTVPYTTLLKQCLEQSTKNPALAIRLSQLFIQGGEQFGLDAEVTSTQPDIDVGTRFIVAHIITVPIKKRWATIQTFEQAGVPIGNILRDHKNIAAPLVADTMKQIDTVTAGPDRFGLLYIISECCTDPHLRLQLKQYLAEQQWAEATDFDRQLAVAFAHGTSRYDVELKDRLIEECMITVEQYQAVHSQMRRYLDLFFDEGSVQVGILAEIDRVLKIKGYTAFKTITLLLGTRHSDNELRDILAKEALSYLSDADTLEETILNARRMLADLDQIISMLFSLNSGAKLAVVKKLVLDSGLMQQPTDRGKLLHALLDETLDTAANETDLRATIRQVGDALAVADDWKLLFLTMGPTLAEHLLVPATKATPWTQVDSVLEALIDVGIEDATPFSATKLTILPQAAATTPWQYEENYGLLGTRRIRAWLKKRGVMETDTVAKRQSPLELVTELAPRLGSLAVRFLQLLPQFVDIPGRYQEQFNTLYDSLRGQSKLTSIGVVEREWPTDQGTMWDTIDQFGKRLGGGSLMTVYEIHTRQSPTAEADKVIRVRNPNITFHLQATRALFDNALDVMLQQGTLDAATHQRLRIGVELVAEWIDQELQFDQFLEHDQTFYHQQHGFGKTEGLDYSILVPKSEPPISNYFQIEEKVPGRNLTDWQALVTEGHDMRAVVSVICKSFAHQIAAGQLHGDVHIGNYRVTPNRQVAILDRTFYIHLDEQERNLFSGLVRGVVDPMALLGYLSKFMPVQEINAMPPTITATISNLGNELLAGNAAAVNHALVDLRQHGVRLPLHISLLTRNVHAYNRLAEQAGFTSLQQALAA